MMFGRSGRVPRQLDARLDRFGAGVAEERSHAAVDRRDRRELLREPHLRLVVEVGARHVQELLRLLGDRADDSGCEWPVEFTAMPAAQSRNTLPSTSSTIAPAPRSMTSG